MPRSDSQRRTNTGPSLLDLLACSLGALVLLWVAFVAPSYIGSGAPELAGSGESEEEASNPKSAPLASSTDYSAHREPLAPTVTPEIPEADAAAAPGVEPPSAKAPFYGRLVDAFTGEAIGNYNVRWFWSGPPELMTTDEDGYFTTNAAYGADRYFVAPSQGGRPDDATQVSFDPRSADGPQDVAVLMGPTVPLDVVVPPGLGPSDLVAFMAIGDDALGSDWGKTRDVPVQGGTPPWVRFGGNAAEQVGEGGPWTLGLGSRDGLWFGSAPLPQVRGRIQDPLAVELRPAGSVAGEVLGLGAPAQNPVTLALQSLPAEDPGALRFTERTGPGGSFRFSYLRAGTYRLALDRATNWDAEPVLIRVEAGVPTPPVTLRVSPAVSAGDLRGTVISDSGTFHGPVSLYVHAGDLLRTKVAWVEEAGSWTGSFEIPNVPPGDHRVDVNVSPMFTPMTVSHATVQAPLLDATIVVHDTYPSYDLELRPVDAVTGEAVGSFKTKLRSDAYFGTDFGGYTDPPTYRGLPADLEFEWTVAAEGYVPAYGTHLDGAAGEGDRVVEIPMARGWGLRVEAFDPDEGKALAGVQVFLDGALAGTTGSDGQLDVSMGQRPDSIGVDQESWRILGGWSVEPETGRFSDELGSSLILPLSPVGD